MRAYVPVGWTDLSRLSSAGTLPGTRPAFTVDPAWREGAPGVTDEEWEFEAQELAAGAVGSVGGGAVLAVDVPDSGAPDDGRTELPGPLSRAQVQAVFSEDLAWFGVQEIPQLLAGR